MDSVLVLIAAPGSRAISAEVVGLLRELGGGAPHWLAEGEACEVPDFERLTEFMVDIRRFPIDAAVVSIHNRRKRLLIADMDSTMIEQECIDELGEMAGVGDRIKDITIRAMRGELDFDGALTERVRLLKGLDAGIIDRIIRERITYMAGGATLIATMKAHGAYTALVSGGFTPFTARVGAHLGFDENQALHRIAARRGHEPADALAVGDGANDLAMLSEAGLGVALHAKPHVQEGSLVRINHGDLTALLYLQGYSRAQFVG